MPTPRTPESGVPIMEQLKRLLPSFMGGYKADQRLPMGVGGSRDPRLGPGSLFDAIVAGKDQVQQLGAGDGSTAAMEALKRGIAR